MSSEREARTPHPDGAEIAAAGARDLSPREGLARLFDVDFYLAQRPDLEGSAIDPVEHYLDVGWREGAQASRIFDMTFYFLQRRDVIAAGVEPIQHYLEHGWREGSRPHRLFDTAFYLSRQGGEDEEFEPLLDYLLRGWRLGAQPHPLFDTSFYLSQRPELRTAGTDPLTHYLAVGWQDGLRPHPLFEPEFYRSQRPDVRAAGVEPLQHYLDMGWREHGQPHPLFMPQYYLARNPYLAEQGVEPLTHYVLHGAEAAGDPHHLFDTEHYRRQAGSIEASPPLLHYVVEGWKDGLSPHGLFDPDHFLRHSFTETSNEQAPLALYCATGWNADAAPHPLFDSRYYTVQLIVQGEFGTPLAHYLHEGWQHGLKPHPLFDPTFYLVEQPDSAGQNPLVHFVRVGRAKGAKTTAKPTTSVVQRLLETGAYSEAATIQTAFAPTPLHPAQRTLSLPFRSHREYARERGLPLHEFTQEWIEVSPPQVFGADRSDLQGGRLPCPPAFVTELRDVLLVGGSRVVVTSDGVLLHDEAFINRLDPHLLVKPSHTIKLVRDEMALVQLERRPVDRIKAGIVLSSDYDQNYFHWMVEVLPKLCMVDELPSLDGIPLLIQSELHPNLLRALALVNVKKRPIVNLDSKIAYRVGHLVYPSDICRTVERSGGRIVFSTDCVLSPKWLRKCADTMLERLGRSTAGGKALFLTRRQGMRRVLNIDDLDLWFAERGYAIETFTDVSLEYQVFRASQARNLVAVTGAAVTNMMFCTPGTRIVIMMSEHRGQNPYVWQQLASCFGHDLRLVAGRRAYNLHEYLIHDDYEIEPAALEQAMS